MLWSLRGIDCGSSTGILRKVTHILMRISQSQRDLSFLIVLYVLFGAWECCGCGATSGESRSGADCGFTRGRTAFLATLENARASLYVGVFSCAPGPGGTGVCGQGRYKSHFFSG